MLVFAEGVKARDEFPAIDGTDQPRRAASSRQRWASSSTKRKLTGKLGDRRAARACRPHEAAERKAGREVWRHSMRPAGLACQVFRIAPPRCGRVLERNRVPWLPGSRPEDKFAHLRGNRGNVRSGLRGFGRWPYCAADLERQKAEWQINGPLRRNSDGGPVNGVRRGDGRLAQPGMGRPNVHETDVGRSHCRGGGLSDSGIGGSFAAADQRG